MNKTEIGRLGFREEGEMWNAYWYKYQYESDEKIFIGSVRMNAARGNAEVKNAFIALMKQAFDHYVRELLGVNPEWSEPRRAPESERSGRA